MPCLYATHVLGNYHDNMLRKTANFDLFYLGPTLIVFRFSIGAVSCAKWVRKDNLFLSVERALMAVGYEAQSFSSRRRQIGVCVYSLPA